MSENLKKFLDLIENDKELEAKAIACNEAGPDGAIAATIALAKEYGIELTEADFEAKAETASGELDDDELDAVAGGRGSCACPALGHGVVYNDNTNKKYSCYCALYGHGGTGHNAPCKCPLVGGGNDDNLY